MATFSSSKAPPVKRDASSVDERFYLREPIKYFVVVIQVPSYLLEHCLLMLVFGFSYDHQGKVLLFSMALILSRTQNLKALLSENSY